MRRKISNLVYKHMVKALGRALDRGVAPKHSDDNPIELDSSAKLNMLLWGDPQISFLSPYRSARVHSAVKDIKNTKGVYDALVLLGDVTEYGKRCEYRMMANLLEGVTDKIKRVYAVSGNHDIRLRKYKKQLMRFNDFLSSMKNGMVGNNEHYYFKSEIDGYKLLMMGADRTAFEASYISEKQINWLDKELESADKGKPVFIFNHQALKNTNGLPATWLGKGNWRGHVGRQSDRIREIFEKHGNVVYITGHLHFGVSEFAFEDYGKFKALSVPTVGVLNHGAYSPNAQGYIMSVFDDKLIFRARLFGNGEYVSRDIKNSYIEIDL